MIPKPLERVEGTDIDLLLAGNVQEGRAIDYKRDLPGGSDSDRKEFLADVSSFANTVGGDLVIGIDEAGGLPTRIVGAVAADLDEDIRRLDGIILSGLDPRIRYAIRPVPSSGRVTVLVIRIEQSWIGPHRVTLKGHDKFYARNSAGKYALDVEELRRAFLYNATVVKRIRAFRAERLIEISRDQTPVAVRQGARLVLHFVPQEAFSTSRLVDVMRYFSSPNLLPPMGARGGDTG